MNKFFVYKIINLITGKVYIGSTNNIKNRFWRHQRQLHLNKHHSIKLQRSYNKYGIDNFKFETIEECSKEDLIQREQYYIDLYDSYNEGYNCLPKAESPLGRKLSDLSKIKIGQASKNRKHTNESKEKIRLANTGKKLSYESRKKVSDSKIGKPKSEETKEKISKTRIESEIAKGRNNPKYNPNSVLQYDLNGNFIKEWQDLISLKEAGFNPQYISSNCRDKRKFSQGYKWKFKNT